MDRRQRQTRAMMGYGLAGAVIGTLAVRFLPTPFDIAALVAAAASFVVWRYKVATREMHSGSPSYGQEELPSRAAEALRPRPARPLRVRNRSTARFRR